MLKTGIVSAAIAAICCFTPALVLLLGLAGLTAWVGWLDYVLLPVLCLSILMIVVAIWRRRSRTLDTSQENEAQ